jgi:hypothetical protein
MRRLGVLTALVVSAALLALPALASAATPVLRLDGIGPLKLGMTRTAALKTGWLAQRGKGCELDRPIPVTYHLTGPSAPAGVDGSAEFQGGKLTNLAFAGGVSTAAGVTVGVTTPAQMVKKYKAAGYAAKAQFDDTFQGTFVTVSKKKKTVLSAFTEKGPISTLAVPVIPVCE